MALHIGETKKKYSNIEIADLSRIIEQYFKNEKEDDLNLFHYYVYYF